ncbi:hypothetical protein FRC04_010715 [Tulasnella sp. 424]|nr:hypothetical protein FRC04_010715 [Tulasnella sp. 424]
MDTGSPKTKNGRKAGAQALQEQPQSPTDITKCPDPASTLFEQLRECLEFSKTYFTACLEEGVQEIAIAELFRVLNPPTPVQTRHVQRPCPSAPEATVVESPTAKSKSLPENSLAPYEIARYLGETTKSTLGDWPVVVSQRGIKHLRQYIARDKNTFARIEKMIRYEEGARTWLVAHASDRQLSMGGFTESSHKRLLEEDYGVPIYTADLGGNLRLVYHIDFGAPTGAGYESQFIRIFGVYSGSEIDVKVDFWKAVGAHLGRRGDEYIRRCTARPETRARSKRAKAPQPLVFRPTGVSHWNQQGADVEVDEAHRLDLHRILSLEKFVPLSHTFFDAIQKFNEASFMFSVAYALIATRTL